MQANLLATVSTDLSLDGDLESWESVLFGSGDGDLRQAAQDKLRFILAEDCLAGTVSPVGAWVNRTVERAVWDGVADRMGILLAASVSPNAQDGDMPLLVRAAFRGHLPIVEMLLRAGASALAADSQGWTALHWAANRGWIAIAKVLLSAGANVEARELDGITPLGMAAHFGQLEISRLLIAGGADVNARDSEGQTPAQRAAGEGFPAVVALLREHGATE